MESDKITVRQERLAAAAKKAGGKAALGRKLGFVDGSPIGQMIKGIRPITETTIEKIEAIDGFAGWFAIESSWPFSQDLYAAIVNLSPEDQWHAENALRAHLKIDPLQRDRPGGEQGDSPTGTHGR